MFLEFALEIGNVCLASLLAFVELSIETLPSSIDKSRVQLVLLASNLLDPAETSAQSCDLVCFERQSTFLSSAQLVLNVHLRLRG